MPTTPRCLFAMARLIISVAWVGDVFSRSIAKIRKAERVFLGFALKVEMVVRIVFRYVSFVMDADGDARGMVRSSRYWTPSDWKSFRTDVVA